MNKNSGLTLLLKNDELVGLDVLRTLTNDEMRFFKYIIPTPVVAVVPRAGAVAVPLIPGRAEIIPGASSTIRAAAPFMRTFTTPTRLTAGYPQVAQADGKFIQIRV